MSLRYDNEAKRNFNSIKVRLNLMSLRYDNEAKRNFNSIKVRLNLGKPRHRIKKYQFQFHKGTIKRVQHPKQHRLQEFQFHKGTIKPNRSWLYTSPMLIDFNSIKVRLNLEIAGFAPVTIKNFNSIKVRLNLLIK